MREAAKGRRTCMRVVMTRWSPGPGARSHPVAGAPSGDLGGPAGCSAPRARRRAAPACRARGRAACAREGAGVHPAAARPDGCD
eukprot:4277488-Pyramimonas_sp.AAC.1